MRRHRVTVLGAAVLTAVLAGSFTWYISGLPTHRPDFAMMWAAMQLRDPYDRAALVAALHWEAKFPVAFVYPPTALPLFGLLGLMSMRAALVLWAAVSAAAMALASRSRWAPFLLLTPPMLWAIPGGQTSVLLGAILLGCLLLLDRPVLSGLLLGFALCLKPQVALALPLLLAVERRWDVLVAAAATFALMAALSALLFGPAEWVQWARSLPAFIRLHEANPLLHRNEIAPGLPLWIRAAALLAGGVLAAIALRRGNPVEAFAIAAGAGLVGSAHAMGYEFAMFVPTLPALIGRRGWSASAIILFVMIPGFIWFGLPPFPFRFLALLLLMAAAAVDGLLAPRAQPELASAGPAHENDGEMVKEPCG
ncbi:MAG TPA: glycosyltransferase family 87 protein [Sphingomicrobium sp.]